MLFHHIILKTCTQFEYNNLTHKVKNEMHCVHLGYCIFHRIV